MKKNEYEKKYIMGIYGTRHKYNDIVIAVPFIIALVFTILVAPILVVLISLPVIVNILLFVVPLPVVCSLLFLRREIIINRFLKVKDIAGKIDLVKCTDEDLGDLKDKRVLMFGASDYMQKVLYNWFIDLGVVADEHLKIYEISYVNSGDVYLGICEDDFVISDENRERYNEETCYCIILEDIVDGKVVNVKLYSKLTK